VVNGEYLRCTNVAANPSQDFAISAEDFAAAEDLGEVTALVHSHPGASALPSVADLSACESAGVPLWIIVSLGAQVDGSIAVDGWHEFGPTGYKAPLIGCPFSHGTHDCYGLVRRYYKLTYGISLPDFPRVAHWWNDGHTNLYTENYEKAGFVSQGLIAELKTGDVLLMKVASRNNVPNHAAVYIGDGWIIHHLWGQLSRRDQLPRYRDYITHTLRHKEVSVDG
jgi:cell wall-associated NlpC family hydrolase